MVGTNPQHSLNWEKENYPIQSVGNNESVLRPNSSVDIKQKPLISNPNSPTVEGLICIKGAYAVSPTGTNSCNFSIKICNCREKTSCEHQSVSFLTKDHSQNKMPSRAQKSLNKDKRLLEVHNDNLLQTANNMVRSSSICSSSSSSEGSSKDLDSSNCSKNKDAQQRWKLPKLGNGDCSSPDMGVSILDSDQCPAMVSCSPTGGCCDGSIVNQEAFREQDFFMYKRRRVDYPTAPNNFERLHNEIILYVFKWLSKATLVKCAQVCWRFNRLALDYTLWRRLDLSSRVLQSGALGRIVLRGCQYLRLSKAELPGAIFSPGRKYLPQFESSLLYLDLSMAVVTPENLVDLFDVCSKLIKVSLEFLTLNDQVFIKLCQNTNLDTLNLSMCEGVTENSLRLLCSELSLLVNLNLSWTKLSFSCLNCVLPHLPRSMERLNLAGFRSSMRDQHIKVICKRCPLLHELDLSDCSELTGVAIEEIVNLKHIKALCFSRCYSIHIDVYNILSRISQLSQLSLFGLTHETGGTLRANLPGVVINRHPFSTVARPTVGVRRTSIWMFRVRDF